MFSEVVDEFVAVSDDDLVARMEQNELERRRLDAETSTLLAIGTARGVHAHDGHRSIAAMCRARFNWSTTEAGRRLGVAAAVDALDGFGDAWMSGRFGMSQALKLSTAHANTRIRDQLAAVVPQLLEHAEQMPYRDFAHVVDHVITVADQDGAHDDRDAAVAGRRARVVEVAATLDVTASGGDALTAAEMIAIHDRFVDIEYRHDLDHNRTTYGDHADLRSLPRTDRQRRFDALIAIFRTAATAADGVGTTAEPLVNVVIDAHTWGRTLLDAGLATNRDLDGQPIDPFTGLATDDSNDLLNLAASNSRRCETASGVPLHPHDVVRAALAGHVRRVVVDSERVVIDMGRRQRLFTHSARHAAKLLIHSCEHAGCDLPADWCEVDHVDEWDRDHGTTDQHNAAILCRTDNNNKHRHRWRTRRATNGCSYTIRDDGTIIMPTGARPPHLTGHDANDTLADDHPETVARLTALARNRAAQIPPPAWRLNA